MYKDKTPAVPIAKSFGEGPDLHSPDVQKLADAQLVQAITQGKGNMPAFGTRLKPDEIDAVVKYVRALGKAK